MNGHHTSILFTLYFTNAHYGLYHGAAGCCANKGLGDDKPNYLNGTHNLTPESSTAQSLPWETQSK